MIRFRRDFTSELDQLPDVRQEVRAACLRVWGTGADDDALTQLELALQEAATNVILHAYDRQGGRPITLEASVDTDACKLTLYHQGKDFDPTAVAAPAFDGTRFGGFGQYLMGQCTDEVRYIHNDQGRHGVQLVKRRLSVPDGRKKMQLIVEKFNDIAVITMHEEQLDASNADDFRQALAPVQKEFNKLVIDLSRVRFVDSRGCGAILSSLKHATEAGGDLRICGVSKPVRTFFDLIRLHRICEICDSKDQAVAAFQKKA
jgi:anti-sigma B factor antagonist